MIRTPARAAVPKRCRSLYPVGVSAEREAARGAIIAAAREFNAGRYFEAHETLEESLDHIPDELWQLFLGLIQIAVGYHKARHQHPGARKMLALGLTKITAYDDEVAGMKLTALRTRVRSDVDAGEGGVVALDSADPPRWQPLRQP